MAPVSVSHILMLLSSLTVTNLSPVVLKFGQAVMLLSIRAAND